jgi:uncharacterized protein YndB with AHSA1/START domain
MRYKMSVTKKLSVPAVDVWEAVVEFGRLDVWFPSIATCRVEGEGVGASRHMSVEGGGEITDRLAEIDFPGRRLSYQRLQSPFPVTSYRGTVEVFSSFDSMAVVAWTVDFESRPEVSEAVAKILEAGIGAGVDGMERELRARSDA